MDTPSLNRRDLLKLSVVGSAALALPLQPVLWAKSASELDESKLPPRYVAPFKAPPVLDPIARDDVAGSSYGTNPRTGAPIPGSAYAGTDYYRITQTPCEVGFISGVKTKMWGYNGLVPGPTIRTYTNAGKPRRVIMQQINQLPATHPTLGYVPWTSTHLHGSPSKPQYDGYAGDLTQPGEWKNYQYPNNCTPRTLWYHDHGVHHTAENVYMGLAAQYHVVDSALEEQLGIPRYNPALPTAHPAQYEAPLILSDVMFSRSGQLMWDDEGHSGVYGDVILVNGVPWPNMVVEPRKYRFRVLNGSLARGYRLRLSNGKPFQVIATDGGFMRNPQTVTQFTIGMAERYEIVIDFAGLAGTKVQLLNSGVNNARDFDHTGKVMQFQVGTTVTSTVGNTVPADFGTGHSAMALSRRHVDGDPPDAPGALQQHVGHQRRDLGRRREDQLRAHVRQDRSQRRRDLGGREQLRRLVPPAAHPPRRLPGPQPQRPAAATGGEGPQGRRLRRGGGDRPPAHEVRARGAGGT